jgi:hypothetical protein
VNRFQMAQDETPCQALASMVIDSEFHTGGIS